MRIAFAQPVCVLMGLILIITLFVLAHNPLVYISLVSLKQPHPQEYQKNQTQKDHERKPTHPLSLRHPLHPSHRPRQISLRIREILILPSTFPFKHKP